MFDGDQPRMTPAGPDFITVVMRTTDVEIMDTWDPLEMRGTDSNDIEANGVFVPESQAFRFEPDSIASAPFDGPLYAEGIADWSGDDYFAEMLNAYVALGRHHHGHVGAGQAQLIDAADLVQFGARWMESHLAG